MALNQLGSSESDCLDEVEVVQPRDENNFGGDLIREKVKNYRMAALSEFDNMGFIVRYERGQYRIGPALKARPEVEGRYYFGPADKRPRGFFALRRMANTNVEALEREQQQFAGVKVVTYDEILEQQQILLGR